jgi:hypothetical protein
MLLSNRTSYFEYWDEAPQDWQRLLEERVARGERQTTIPILWGVHESSLGIRDFSKQSKLRIEKLLTLVQSSGLAARIILGFPPHPQSFPSWVQSGTESEVVPKVLWDGYPPYYSFVRIPSPKDPKLKEHYFAFFEEVCSFLNLYLSPEGPIKEVEVSLFPLEKAQTLLADPKYIELLTKRYRDVATFNSRFQTSYKNLSSVVTPSGARLVESKRPWLFAYDYRWVRDQLVKEYFSEFLKQPITDGLKKIIKPSHGAKGQAVDSDTRSGVCFEGMFVQFEDSVALSPLLIEGLLTPSSSQAFQWTKMLIEESDKALLGLSPLPILEGDPTPNYSSLAVICGKYMTQRACGHLREQLKRGAKLFFPMGTPQYDENLESHEIFFSGARQWVKVLDVEWVRFEKEGGQLFLPAQASLMHSSTGLSDWLNRFSSVQQELLNG